MSDLATRLIVTMLQQKFPGVDDEENLTDYVERYGQERMDAGQLLMYLGLARRSQTNDIGWKPTPLFVEILVQRAAKRQIAGNFHEAKELIDRLREEVFSKYRESQVGAFGFEVLQLLGLVREHSGGWEVTQRFEEINCCYAV